MVINGDEWLLMVSNDYIMVIILGGPKPGRNARKGKWGEDAQLAAVSQDLVS